MRLRLPANPLRPIAGTNFNVLFGSGEHDIIVLCRAAASDVNDKSVSFLERIEGVDQHNRLSDTIDDKGRFAVRERQHVSVDLTYCHNNSSTNAFPDAFANRLIDAVTNSVEIGKSSTILHTIGNTEQWFADCCGVGKSLLFPVDNLDTHTFRHHHDNAHSVQRGDKGFSINDFLQLPHTISVHTIHFCHNHTTTNTNHVLDSNQRNDSDTIHHHTKQRHTD